MVLHFKVKIHVLQVVSILQQVSFIVIIWVALYDYYELISKTRSDDNKSLRNCIAVQRIISATRTEHV